jgi:hypothetical protein
MVSENNHLCDRLFAAAHSRREECGKPCFCSSKLYIPGCIRAKTCAYDFACICMRTDNIQYCRADRGLWTKRKM